MELSEDKLRERFKANRQEREAILAKTQPLRSERDKLVQAYEPRVRELSSQIKEIEVPRLAELENEAAMITRALKGRTG